MKYQVSLDMDPQTLITDTDTEVLPLPMGILKEASIFFPWGCAGLAHIRIIHNEHVLYPTNPDEWFSGNNILITFECLYELTENWNRFKIEGYNEDDMYSHTPIIAFVVLPSNDEPFTFPVWLED